MYYNFVEADLDTEINFVELGLMLDSLDLMRLASWKPLKTGISMSVSTRLILRLQHVD
jgi:aryl carrier-like protein